MNQPEHQQPSKKKNKHKNKKNKNKNHHENKEIELTLNNPSSNNNNTKPVIRKNYKDYIKESVKINPSYSNDITEEQELENLTPVIISLETDLAKEILKRPIPEKYKVYELLVELKKFTSQQQEEFPKDTYILSEDDKRNAFIEFELVVHDPKLESLINHIKQENKDAFNKSLNRIWNRHLEQFIKSEERNDPLNESGPLEPTNEDPLIPSVKIFKPSNTSPYIIYRVSKSNIMEMIKELLPNLPREEDSIFTTHQEYESMELKKRLTETSNYAHRYQLDVTRMEGLIPGLNAIIISKYVFDFYSQHNQLPSEKEEMWFTCSNKISKMLEMNEKKKYT